MMDHTAPETNQPDKFASPSSQPASQKKKRALPVRLLLSPEEPRLRAGWRLLLQVMAQNTLLIGGYLLLNLIPWRITSNELLLAQIGMLLAVTISIFLARIVLDRRSISSLGLRFNFHTLGDLLAGFFIAGLMMALIFALEYYFGWLAFINFAWENQAWETIVVEVSALLLVFIIVGWQEELLSRGYQLQNLKDGLNLTWGVVLSSLIFALMHLGNPNSSLPAVLGLFASGLFLAFSYLRTNLLWLPIGIHIGWNFFEGPVFGFPVSGLEMYRILHQTVQGPELFTGGKFGPEAGLILVPALALGILLVSIYSSGRTKGSQGIE